MDYFSWSRRKERGRGTRLEDYPPDREEPARPSEPIEVQEHHANTTIVERIRDAIRSRLRTE